MLYIIIPFCRNCAVSSILLQFSTLKGHPKRHPKRHIDRTLKSMSVCSYIYMIPLEPVFPGFLLPLPPPPSSAGVVPADHPMLLSSPPAALVCRALRLPPELKTGDRTPSNIFLCSSHGAVEDYEASFCVLINIIVQTFRPYEMNMTS
jgi:hypothetical protein